MKERGLSCAGAAIRGAWGGVDDSLRLVARMGVDMHGDQMQVSEGTACDFQAARICGVADDYWSGRRMEEVAEAAVQQQCTVASISQDI